jgi:hypothetical protein
MAELLADRLVGCSAGVKVEKMAEDSADMTGLQRDVMTGLHWAYYWAERKGPQKVMKSAALWAVSASKSVESLAGPLGIRLAATLAAWKVGLV